MVSVRNRFKMEEKPFKVKFRNKINPDSTFDLLKLEELIQRKSLSHDTGKLHKVEFFVILFILEGQGYHTIDFTDYKYEKGTLLTIRKDQIQKFFKDSSTKGYLLLFTDDFLVSYLEKLEAQKSLQLFNELVGVPKIQLSQHEFEEIKSIVKRIEKEYFAEGDDYTLDIIRSELHILTTKLYRIKSKNNQVVVNKKYLPEFIELQKLVEDNVNHSTKTSDYARMMGVSTKTLNAISKSIVNKTAKEFIDEIATKQIKRFAYKHSTFHQGNCLYFWI